MNAARRLGFAMTCLVAWAAVATACAPGPVPPTSTAPSTSIPPTTLPSAPRLQIPASLPPGTRLLVEHYETGAAQAPDFYLVGDSEARLLDLDTLDLTSLLPAYGRVAADGRALVTDDERPDLGLRAGLAVCSSVTSASCRAISAGHSTASSFSPDGTKIAYVERDEATNTEWLTILDADSLSLLTRAQIAGVATTLRLPWSPSSNAVAVSIRQDPADPRSPRSLATLAASTGATPQVLLAGSTAAFAIETYGWSDDGWISYLWQDVTDPANPGPSIRSVPVDGSSPPGLLRRGALIGVHVALPDGSMIGPALAPADHVPHLLRRGQEPMPLALPQRWYDESGPRSSVTQVYGYLEPGR